MLKASSWSLRTKSIPTLTSHCKEQTKNVRESSWQTINHCIPLSLVAFLHVTDSECHRLALHSLCISPVISSLMIRFYASTETVQSITSLSQFSCKGIEKQGNKQLFSKVSNWRSLFSVLVKFLLGRSAFCIAVLAWDLATLLLTQLFLL